MWLVRQFWLFYNVNPAILEGCPRVEKIRLAFFGLLTLLICIFAILSGVYLGYLVTEKVEFSALIGAILGWNFVNIYRLILITFDLHSKGKPNTKIGTFISCLLRGICLLLLIIIIIKPCELLYFNSAIQKELDKVVFEKERQVNEDWLQFIDDRISLYKGRINELQEEKLAEEKIIELNTGFSTDHLIELANEKIKGLNEQIDYLEEVVLWFESTKKDYLSEFEGAVKSSSYLVERFKILVFRFPESWFITLILGGIFLFPILMKMYAVKKFVYFQKEALAAQTLILEEYSSFKEAYREKLFSITGRDIQYFETYADPPFNTELIEGRQNFGDHQDFQNWASKFY